MENKLLGNRYELIEEIGIGGMARVYKAKCTLLNRYVAIKILKDEFSRDPDFLKRFKHEAQAAAGLSNQNIVSIFDVGSDGGENYIVMEYVDGITLKKYLQEKGVLSEKEVLEISLQVCKALIHAHKHGVVHRDIKPHNIIIKEDGSIKVADFGIARAASASTITLAGNTVGSVHYFSPEQARGLPTDIKSDMYSLGTTIYELVTGKLVFEADTPIAVALKHIQEEPVPPISINPIISYNMNNLIVRLLSKNPDNRFESVHDLLKNIEKMLNRPNKENKELKSDTEMIDLKTEDQMFKGRRKRRREAREVTTTIIAVMVSIATVALFAYLVFGIIIPSLDPAVEDVREIVIENYTGDKIENVTKILDEYSIEIVRDEVYDEDAKPGEILGQSISPNSTLKEGAKITLTISLGPEYVSFRDFRYADYREAENELKELGLKPIIVSEFSEIFENGNVISTDPESGTSVRLGTEIIIKRSLGKEILYVFVPNLVDLTYDEAVDLIEINNLILDLTVNYGKEGYSDIISYQSPSADVKVPEGTNITLFFAKLVPETDPSQDPTDPDGTEETQPSDTSVIEDENFFFIEQSISLSGVTLADVFSFAVETRTSLEDQYNTHFLGDYNKEDLPYNFLVKVPKNGFADIRIYVDNKFLKEIRVLSPEVQ